jgi:hypothetical protein
MMFFAQGLIGLLFLSQFIHIYIFSISSIIASTI